MTAEQILDEIRRIGARLEVRGDRLHVEAPRGAIGPDLKAALAERKAELLQRTSLDHLSSVRADGQPCIALAIDRETGGVVLIFSAATLEAVTPYAEIHRMPVSVPLTEKQRAEIERDLKFLEGDKPGDQL